MKKLGKAHIISIGLAIFSMFFGAGNLIYPIMVGVESGTKTAYGMLGFLLTAVLLPVAGLLGMILFDGNYQHFFHRMGQRAGNFFIIACMLIIGPVIAIPRIVTLSHTMTAPFLPFEILKEISPLSSFIFACIFLGITFLATYRENRIVDVLGYIISPALLLALATIIIKGILSAQEAITTTASPWQLFSHNIIRGYETLDLIAAIFFSSVVLHILKNKIGGSAGYNQRELAIIGLKSSVIGISLLAIVYIGMSILGIYHGNDLDMANAAEIFQRISLHILGNGGSAIIGTAVLMACLSTAIALTAVVAEYIQYNIFNNKIRYIPSLIITLLLCLPLSIGGIEKVLALTGGPIVYIGYPMIIAITICNILYKVIGFKPIRIPVFITGIIAGVTYFI